LKDIRSLLGLTARQPRPAQDETEDVDKAEGEPADESDSESGAEESDGEPRAERDGDEEAEEPSEDEKSAAEPKASGSGVDRALLAKLLSPSPPPTGASGAQPVEDDEDDYDRHVRALLYEPRAKPTDRLKTEEELLAEEAEKLRKAEEARLRRMRGEEEPTQVDDRKGKRKAPQADDLEDDFVDEDEEDRFGLGRGLDDGQEDQEMVVLSAGSAEEDGSDGDEESDEEEEEEEEESEAEGEGLLSDEEDAEVDTGHAQALVQPSASTSKSLNSKGELPYSFPCPESHDDLLQIMGNLPEGEVVTLIDRVKVLYHPKLGEANKGKLQVRRQSLKLRRIS
jgi:nucleolar protein 14